MALISLIAVAGISMMPSVSSNMSRMFNEVSMNDLSLAPVAEEDPELDGFIVRFDTSVPGGDNTVRIFMSGVAGDVDWGDGTTEAMTEGGMTHTYASGGVYTAQFTGAISQFGPGYNMACTSTNYVTPEAVEVVSFGNVGLQSVHCGFGSMTNLAALPAELPNTVTSLQGAFGFVKSTPAVVGSWDVSNVTDFRNTWQGAKDFPDITAWDTTAGEDFSRMFAVTTFNQDIGGWSTGSAENFSEMFTDTPFSQYIGDWDVGNVTEFNGMFYLNTAYNQPFTNWEPMKTSPVSFTGAFWGATAFNQPLDFLSGAQLGWTRNMFRGATSFDQDVNMLDVSQVQYFNDMFRDASAFSKDVSGFDVSSGLDFRTMFYNASNLDPDISTWTFEHTNLTDFFLTNSGLSEANYDGVLSALAAANDLTTRSGNETLDVGSLRFSSAAQANRDLLTSNNWIISDGGLR